MMKKVTLVSDEILLATRENSMALSRLVKKKLAKKIGPRLYTTALDESPDQTVRRNLWTIVALLYPGAIISHRSSFDTKPTADGRLFLTYKYSRRVRLPGIILNLIEGPSDTSGTSGFLSSLFISQSPRAFLENLQSTKKRSSATQKCLSPEEIEEKLDTLCRIHGPERLNQIRDEAEILSKKLKMGNEFRKLNALISALLSTGPARNLKTPRGKARNAGASYDPFRIERFEVLYSFLAKREYPDIGKSYSSKAEFETQAFFEAYFSNYIEGTRFPIEEARAIIYDGKMPKNRPDAHDILGSFRLMTDKAERKALPKNAEHFLTLLKVRHRLLMVAHPTALPGSFKEEANQAGTTLFVEPKAVPGTLIKGYGFYELLRDPFKKALYLMFLISEVHPFADGNGRIARLFMNSVLYSHALEKIIVPNVYRDDYLGALKRLTHQGDPEPYVRAMSNCQKFTNQVDFSSYEAALKDLTARNAFAEPSEAMLVTL